MSVCLFVFVCVCTSTSFLIFFCGCSLHLVAMVNHGNLEEELSEKWKTTKTIRERYNLQHTGWYDV